MGCVYCKCCPRYPSSPSSDGKRFKSKRGKNAAGADELLLEVVYIPSHDYKLEYSVLTRRGYYPDMPNKENQDCFCIKTSIQGNPNAHFFGVFDGHGQSGKRCSNFVKDRVLELLCSDTRCWKIPLRLTLRHSDGDHHRVVAQDLSYDQTPFRRDELERVKKCGARVLSVDQVEGVKDPSIQSWGDEESAGDRLAEKIGVVAVPEVSMVELTANHPFFLLASDGVFEFLSSQAVVDMVDRYIDPRRACGAVSAESYKLWLEHENRTDDITIIIVHINGLSNRHTRFEKPVSPPASEMFQSVVSDFTQDSKGGPMHRVQKSDTSDMFQSVFSDITQDTDVGVLPFSQKSQATPEMHQSNGNDFLEQRPLPSTNYRNPTIVKARE
ncbi:hypothetical protein OSB04_010527 [Centaurea solstitialis]|uniref:protein-serine/threonine phosphatase n=1 Tax=Centaurea solstitialis TaxID=347529 RepID=A0AA38T7S3_9ASTR|nr:hypothetical protein OSB04_010527 [Centaurea solstitialis]